MSQSKGSDPRRRPPKAKRLGNAPDNAEPQKKRVRRFNFAGLPQLTKEQVNITNRLMDFLPQTPFEQGFKDQIRAVLEPLVRADIDFWFHSIAHVQQEQLSDHLASPTCVVRVGLLPHEEDMLVEVDLVVAQQCINRLLGGSEHTDNSRSLSDIEEGVFGFVMLKALEQVQSTFGNEQEVALKLKRMYGDPAQAVAGTVPAPSWTCLSFKLFFDLHVGFARVYIPTHFVDREFVVARPSDGPALSRSMLSLLERENRIAAIDTSLGIELGRISFSQDDINALDVGDIVLLDQPKVTISGGIVEGAVECRIDKGHAGYILGSLTLGAQDRYEVAIENIIASGVPEAEGSFAESEDLEEEHSYSHPIMNAENLMNNNARSGRPFSFAPGDVQVLPTDRDALCESDAEHNEEEEGLDNNDYQEELYDEQEEGEFEAEEPLPESAGLLGDVNVAMVIELGRVQVTAADVLNVRPGQVIELTRSPGDPVDLVVDGKRVGRGELVEIEGELGVRILDLIR